MAVRSTFLPQTGTLTRLIKKDELKSARVVIRVGYGKTTRNLIYMENGKTKEFRQSTARNCPETTQVKVSGAVMISKAVAVPRSTQSLVALSFDGDVYILEDPILGTPYCLRKIKMTSKVLDIAANNHFIALLTYEGQVNIIKFKNIDYFNPVLIVGRSIGTQVVKIQLFQTMVFILGANKRLYRWNLNQDLDGTLDQDHNEDLDEDPKDLDEEIFEEDVFGQQVQDIAASLFELAILTTSHELYVLNYVGRPLFQVPMYAPKKIGEIRIGYLIGTDTKIIAIGQDDYIYPLERLVENYLIKTKTHIPQRMSERFRRANAKQIRKRRIEDYQPNEIFHKLFENDFLDRFPAKKEWLAPHLKKCLRYQLNDSKLRSCEIVELFLNDIELANVTIPFPVVVNFNPILDRLYRLSSEERETLRGTPYDFVVDTFEPLVKSKYSLESLLQLHFYQNSVILDMLMGALKQMNCVYAKKEGPGVYHDIVLAVEGNENQAPEKIYACRAYFQLVSPHLKMLFDYWAEQEKNVPVLIKGPAMENLFVSAFQFYVEFLHTGTLDITSSEEFFLSLLEIGRCHLDQVLIDLCIDNITEMLNDLSQCDRLYHVADCFELPELTRRVNEFVAEENFTSPKAKRFKLKMEIITPRSRHQNNLHRLPTPSK